MNSEYRRLVILQLLDKSSVNGVAHELLVCELERLAVDGTDAQIVSDANFLKRAGAIDIDAIAHGDTLLIAYRIQPFGEEHLKRLRTITGVHRAPLRRG